MNKFLLHITSLVALVLFLTMGACNNTPKAPILLEAEKTIEKQPDSALNYLGRVNSDLQDALQLKKLRCFWRWLLGQGDYWQGVQRSRRSLISARPMFR